MPGNPPVHFHEPFESYAGIACTLSPQFLSRVMPVGPVRSHFNWKLGRKTSCTLPHSFSRVMPAMLVCSHFIRKLCREILCTLPHSEVKPVHTYMLPPNLFSRVMPAMPVHSLSIRKSRRKTPRTLPRTFENYAGE